MENNGINRHIIVGTSGHVDHGKTSLTKVLTGTDTDRLQEEKKRGITIELGFTNLTNDKNIDISIIDVPGHERFIHNMLSGIGGIDMVLLLVAADEGIMLQTKEHFEIVKMLGINKGIIVITKKDLVEDEFLELIHDDIDGLVENTFLQDAPRFEVSSYTGENIDVLKDAIVEMALEIEGRRQEPSLTRLPIDRIFVMEGFGTVVTGTLVEGKVSVGDELTIYPQMLKTKVRNLQVHGKKAETAFAGQRVAVNLLNVKKEELERGNVLAPEGSMANTMMIDANLEMFKSTGRTLKNGSRIHFSFGPAEILAKVVLLNKEVLEPGESGYAQLRLEENIAMKKGDRFIIRFFSPVESIGGGEVLESNPKKHKRFRDDVMDSLEQKYVGDDIQVVEQTIKENRYRMSEDDELMSKLGFTFEQWNMAKEELIKSGKIVDIGSGISIHGEALERIKGISSNILDEFHKKNPFAMGILKEEYRNRISLESHIDKPRVIELIIKQMIASELLQDLGARIELVGYKVEMTDDQRLLSEKVENKYLEKGFEPPETSEITAEFKASGNIVEALVEQGKLVKLSPSHRIHKSFYDEALKIVNDTLDAKGEITLGQFRDLVGSSRKYAILILEHFDSKGITVMKDNKRVRVVK
ncbi:MAG: selenocysteine-specific translation elongation factor [Tissierellia bacterium]|nr:selenocysteine-specific translation elongation factor [Tissierellia bacterium]